jgi:hypothetical protein
MERELERHEEPGDRKKKRAVVGRRGRVRAGRVERGNRVEGLIYVSLPLMQSAEPF